MLRLGRGWRSGQVPNGNPQHSSNPNGVLYSCFLQSEYVCVLACVSVCIFTLLPYQLIFPHCGVGTGSRGLRGLWVCAKTIIKDRDCRRLCENVFMYVCKGRRQDSLQGKVLIPNGRVRTGRVKSVCMRGVWGGGSP